MARYARRSHDLQHLFGPTFLSPEADGFEAERAQLIDLVRYYGEHGPIKNEPHPFFGPLTEEDWSRLLWKHTDHHLRQFDGWRTRGRCIARWITPGSKGGNNSSDRSTLS